METIKAGLIDDFGIGYVKFGHSELMGRVVGLLLCEPEPISIDDICDALNVTKTPVNQICRRLEERNLIKRVRIVGERKYYYQISPEVFLQAGVNLLRLFEDSLQIAENHLHPLLEKYATAKGEERSRIKIVCERLIRMREFHLRQMQAYQRFVAAWREAQNNLPSVDDYVGQIGITAA